MVMKRLHIARHLTGTSAALTLALLAGCTSAPEQPEPMPVEKSAPAPVKKAEPQPVVELRPDYPQKYTVVKGDTLWDISSHFLKDPWMWPELWQINPDIKNPHLIYPGDVLTLYFIDGKPRMRVDRPSGPEMPNEVRGKEYPTVKLEPEVREEGLGEAVPTIPLEAIRNFLTRPRVVTAEELEMQPYIMAHTENRLASGAGYTVYARGIKQDEIRPQYDIVRAGQEYVDPDTDEVLGYEAIYLGEARLKDYGDPSTLYVTQSNREILRGDRLMPKGDDRLQYRYMPRAPQNEVNGKIIAVMDGVAQVGQYQVVVLNLGRQEDIETGNVLAVMQRGSEVKDIVSGDEVKLPDTKAGTVMVFRVFERVSYALVMQVTKPLHINDTVTNP